LSFPAFCYQTGVIASKHLRHVLTKRFLELFGKSLQTKSLTHNNPKHALIVFFGLGKKTKNLL